jgi:NTP pyrophosphatase (non-canonical NTP hydrolase)
MIELSPIAAVDASPNIAVTAGAWPMLYSRFVATLVKDMGSDTLNTLHAAVGVSGEAGELLDAVKKHWAYNKPLDRENVIEELGDLMFYITHLMCVMKLSYVEIINANVTKLRHRYPQGYTDADAQARADKLTALPVLDSENPPSQHRP